jgi:hypothetical protein
MTDDDDLDAGEILCIDCGCALRQSGSDAPAEPRCDTDDEHFRALCGEDCPVLCPGCRQHHFAPYGVQTPKRA